jgi:uncharacterized protein (DUF433 family)
VAAIEEWIIGKNGKRNRKILYRRLIDGLTIERIAEEFDLSPAQIKAIIKNGSAIIQKHL